MRSTLITALKFTSFLPSFSVSSPPNWKTDCSDIAMISLYPTELDSAKRAFMNISLETNLKKKEEDLS